MITVIRRRPKRVDIYTDGAVSGNPGPGGWAWAIWPQPGDRGTGGAHNTTNQRMEMQAVVEAIQAMKPQPLRICTDSAYVMNCFTDGWWKGWTNGHKRNGDTVSNWDIWSVLIPLVQTNDVTWLKVKGHSGIPGNEYVDGLAVAAKMRFFR